jgi:predicted metal-dependent phosphoesterase TrpH
MLLKIDLHTHTSDDPVDPVPYSARELIARAATLGYHALAITLHDRQLDIAPLVDHASARGIVLIPGVEQTIERRHVLLLNFSARAATIRTFADLARLKDDEGGLVIAPHPFFPLSSCVGALIDRYARLFDAVEINAMHVPGMNFNRAAVRWAARHGKPLVGNGDVHRLAQLGPTYSLVDAEPGAGSICEAIRAGRVEVHTTPLTWRTATTIFGSMVAARIWPSAARWPPMRPPVPAAD